MTSPMPMAIPIDPAHCPRCGRPNQCTMAAGRPSERCWCTDVVVPAALLDALPAEARGAACLCAACIAEANAPTPVSDTVSDT